MCAAIVGIRVVTVYCGPLPVFKLLRAANAVVMQVYMSLEERKRLASQRRHDELTEQAEKRYRELRTLHTKARVVGST